MVRFATSTVEVIAPDGTNSLWVVALPHSEAVAAVRKVIPSGHIAELSLRRLSRSQTSVDLSPGEVRKIERGKVRKIEGAIHPEPTPIPQTIIKSGETERPRTVSCYQAFSVASDGKVMGFKEMRCLDDSEAVATAKRLARHSDVEVWNGDRFIIRLVRTNK
jgi:hypothetical protein